MRETEELLLQEELKYSGEKKIICISVSLHSSM